MEKFTSQNGWFFISFVMFTSILVYSVICNLSLCLRLLGVVIKFDLMGCQGHSGRHGAATYDTPPPTCHHHHHPLPPLIWSILYTDQFSISGYLIPAIFYILYEAIKYLLIRGGGGVSLEGGGCLRAILPGGGGGSSYSSFLLCDIIRHLYSAWLELGILPHCKTWFRYLPSTCSTPP